MKKENFISLLLGTIGGLLFALGMCMCLLPEWNAFSQGVVIGAIGVVILIAMLLIRRKMMGKPALRLTRKTLGAIVLGAFGSLLLGGGMAMIMVWNQLIWGILVGVAGLILLVCLIPVCVGLK